MRQITRVLTNSKFGLFYSNFLILTPTFSKVPIEKYGKTPIFSGKQHFYSYFQNPSENSDHCPRASFPLIHGSRGLQCRLSLLKNIVCELRCIVANVFWRNDQTISITIKYAPLSYRTGGNRKRSEQSMNVDHKSLETVFSIII